MSTSTVRPKPERTVAQETSSCRSDKVKSTPAKTTDHDCCKAEQNAKTDSSCCCSK